MSEDVFINSGNATREPQPANSAQIPTPGCAQGNTARSGTTGYPTNEEHPGVKKIVGERSLSVFEESSVEWAGGVIEGEEDNALTTTHRWHLGGNFYPGNKYGLLIATLQEVAGANNLQSIEAIGIKMHDVATDVKAKYFKFGTNPFSTIHFRQTRTAVLAVIGDVETQLSGCNQLSPSKVRDLQE